VERDDRRRAAAGAAAADERLRVVEMRQRSGFRTAEIDEK
jgi:hypothetical protein